MYRSAKAYAVNSKWTHLKGCKGWKHFRIVTIRNTKAQIEIEVMAVCDRNVRFWLLMDTLKKDKNWHPGWLP